ncbi:MAG: dihydropteroate synthase [Cytophagaceae bacterium SCN 52-12]|nr:MAG: dihydropteroate synthase [Cytophagaceae bacterium SCN 52-12]
MRQDSKKTLNIGGEIRALDRPLVMGILNITPDSFYEGSRITDARSEDLVSRAGYLLGQGASILDIGGYSTRPGAREISAAEELDRVLPAITAVRRHFPGAAISVDTFRAEVAKAAVHAGAHIINDVSGGNLDPEMFETVAGLKVPYVLMHMRGTPQTMNSLTGYQSFPADVIRELREKLARLRELGAADIIIDPGFGFAKTSAQNFALLSALPLFGQLGCPVMVGVSRKSTIYKTLGVSPGEALNGTTVLNTIALMNGAQILRVHDAAEARQAIILTEQVTNSKL